MPIRVDARLCERGRDCRNIEDDHKEAKAHPKVSLSGVFEANTAKGLIANENAPFLV